MFGHADKMFAPAPGVVTDFDIDSNAFFGDISFDMTSWFGFRFIPHVGVLWTQGDDNPTDNKLEGYVGKNFQRFTPSFGGENTILADTNPVIGTILYSFLPDQRGNQNATLGVGGLVGTGRGDNPGLLLVGGGLTVDPIKNWTYRTNAYYMEYQELPVVATVLAGSLGPAGTNVRLTKRDVGVEWDNEVSWWLDKNFVVKGQFSFIFPGDALKEITGIWRGNRQEADDTAIRLALELLWNF